MMTISPAITPKCQTGPQSFKPSLPLVQDCTYVTTKLKLSNGGHLRPQ